MKKKEFIFDVEYIHDMDVAIMGKKQIIPISSHRITRGLTLQQLIELIKLNEVPVDKNEKHQITLNIRGVNF